MIKNELEVVKESVGVIMKVLFNIKNTLSSSISLIYFSMLYQVTSDNNEFKKIK